MSLMTPDWISRKMKRLLDASGDIISVNDIHYAGHPWTIVKLLLLSGWVYVYTTIIPKYFRTFRYVDLLAGSGTTRIGETGDIVIGSPFIPYFFARNPFTSYVFIEKRRDRREALRQRATKMLGERGDVLDGDCNELIQCPDAAILPCEEGTHGFVFIDNEGFDVVWDTIQKILAANTDVLLLFPTSSTSRVAGTESTQACLNRFYGCDSWNEARNEEGFLEIYLRLLEKEFENLRRKQVYVSSVRVGSGQFFYDLILVCRKGPYIQAWEYLKRKLDWKDPQIIEITLDVLKGRATRMDWFLGLQENVESLGWGKQASRYKETTLNSF